MDAHAPDPKDQPGLDLAKAEELRSALRALDDLDDDGPPDETEVAARRWLAEYDARVTIAISDDDERGER
jgi:hypothetical protein